MIKIEPLHAEFGAEISGVNLAAKLDDSAFAEIDEAINQFSLLLFRSQDMNDEAHLGFTRRFGELEEEHVSYYSKGEVTYIGLVGNVDANGERVPGRRVNSQRGNQMWHSDSSFREIPALYSILSAYEVPAQKGETEFASGRAAYSRLDQDTRELIDPLLGIHDYIYSRTKVSEDAVTQSQRTYMHPVRQRLVRRNPVTGEKNLYVGSHVRTIEGLPDEEAKSLIERLLAEVTRPQSVYRHKWSEGDFVIWDNRCMLHRGCGYDAHRYRRRMHQTRVRGHGPSIAETL